MMPVSDRLALHSLLKKLVRLAPKVMLGDRAAIAQCNAQLSDVDESTLGEGCLPSIEVCTNQPAPVLYGEVYEHSDFHASLFGFTRAGRRIPLHDHPEMHGFIKCVRGALMVRSFSLLDQKGVDWSGRQKVRFEGESIVTPGDGCVYLEPATNNLHEIQSLEDGSFFFDVLMPGYKDCDCTYYSPPPSLPRIGQNCLLYEYGTCAPRDFYCQDMRYNRIEEL